MTHSIASSLSVTTHDGYLSDQETDRLIRIAQAVPFFIETETYGTTPEADEAMEQLTRAFLPLIHKVARTSTVLDPEDALMTCLEEFISCVRRYEVGSALPFKAGLRTILTRRIGDVGRTSGPIVVKENAAARYRQIMDRHDWNLEAAYAECKTDSNGFTPDTFLAVHNALRVDSLDVTTDQNDSSSRVSTGGGSGYSQYEEHLADNSPTPEAITVQTETVRHLFTLVPSSQESILRLSYGFADLATENARLAAGFRADGSPLSDREVAQVLGMRTPTVNRHRNAALDVMRADLEADGEDVTPDA